MSTIPFDEIVPGATVRFTNMEGDQYLSVRDCLMHLCGKTAKRANEKWDRLSAEAKKEVAAFCGHFQFPGQGNKPEVVITFKGALKLAMLVSGEKAAMHRAAMVNILSRYYAGDGSLTDEIEANATSTSPVAEMARNALAAEGTLENPKKRARASDNLSAEIFCNEVSTILRGMETEITGQLRGIAAGQEEMAAVCSQVEAISIQCIELLGEKCTIKNYTIFNKSGSTIWVSEGSSPWQRAQHATTGAEPIDSKPSNGIFVKSISPYTFLLDGKQNLIEKSWTFPHVLETSYNAFFAVEARTVKHAR